RTFGSADKHQNGRGRVLPPFPPFAWNSVIPVSRRLAACVLALAAASGVGSAQRPGNTPLSAAAGLLTRGRDGQLRVASAARLHHEASLLDKLGSFVFGLGFNAPGFDSAALCLVRLTPRGLLDS